jgi:hypothetical protein
MGDDRNESEKLLKQARTCNIDLLDLLDEIEKELENNKDNKDALEAKRVVKDRLAAKEAMTGISQ